MRRLGFFALVALWFVAGCGEDPQAQAIRDARQQGKEARRLLVVAQHAYDMLDNARQIEYALGESAPSTGTEADLKKHHDAMFAQLQEAAAGGIDTSDKAVADAIKIKGLVALQQALIDQAEAKFQSLLNKGTKSQRAEAHRLLAMLKTRRGQHLRNEAMLANDRLAMESSRLFAYVDALQAFETMTKTYGDDDQPFEEKLREHATTNAGDVAKLKAEASLKQSNIDELERQIAALEQQRDQAFQQATAKNAEAFTAEGQKQYELYIEAIKFEQQGDAADIRIQELRAGEVDDQGNVIEPGLDRLKAEVSVLNQELAMLDARKEALAGGLASVGERKTRVGEVESAMAVERDRIVQELAAGFDRLSNSYATDVDGQLEAADEQFVAAIKLLDTATTLAMSDLQQRGVAIARVSAETSRLNTINDRIAVGVQFAELTGHLDKAVRGIVKPSVQDPIRAAHTAATALVDELVKQVAEVASSANTAIEKVKVDIKDSLNASKFQQQLDAARKTTEMAETLAKSMQETLSN